MQETDKIVYKIYAKEKLFSFLLINRMKNKFIKIIFQEMYFLQPQNGS